MLIEISINDPWSSNVLSLNDPIKIPIIQDAERFYR